MSGNKRDIKVFDEDRCVVKLHVSQELVAIAGSEGIRYTNIAEVQSVDAKAAEDDEVDFEQPMITTTAGFDDLLTDVSFCDRNSSFYAASCNDGQGIVFTNDGSYSVPIAHFASPCISVDINAINYVIAGCQDGKIKVQEIKMDDISGQLECTKNMLEFIADVESIVCCKFIENDIIGVCGCNEKFSIWKIANMNGNGELKAQLIGENKKLLSKISGSELVVGYQHLVFDTLLSYCFVPSGKDVCLITHKNIIDKNYCPVVQKFENLQENSVCFVRVVATSEINCYYMAVGDLKGYMSIWELKKNNNGNSNNVFEIVNVVKNQLYTSKGASIGSIDFKVISNSENKNKNNNNSNNNNKDKMLQLFVTDCNGYLHFDCVSVCDTSNIIQKKSKIGEVSHKMGQSPQKNKRNENVNKEKIGENVVVDKMKMQKIASKTEEKKKKKNNNDIAKKEIKIQKQGINENTNSKQENEKEKDKEKEKEESNDIDIEIGSNKNTNNENNNNVNENEDDDSDIDLDIDLDDNLFDRIDNINIDDDSDNDDENEKNKEKSVKRRIIKRVGTNNGALNDSDSDSEAEETNGNNNNSNSNNSVPTINIDNEHSNEPNFNNNNNTNTNDSMNDIPTIDINVQSGNNNNNNSNNNNDEDDNHSNTMNEKKSVSLEISGNSESTSVDGDESKTNDKYGMSRFVLNESIEEKDDNLLDELDDNENDNQLNEMDEIPEIDVLNENGDENNNNNHDRKNKNKQQRKNVQQLLEDDIQDIDVDKLDDMSIGDMLDDGIDDINDIDDIGDIDDIDNARNKKVDNAAVYVPNGVAVARVAAHVPFQINRTQFDDNGQRYLTWNEIGAVVARRSVADADTLIKSLNIGDNNNNNGNSKNLLNENLNFQYNYEIDFSDKSIYSRAIRFTDMRNYEYAALSCNGLLLACNIDSEVTNENKQANRFSSIVNYRPFSSWGYTSQNRIGWQYNLTNSEKCVCIGLTPNYVIIATNKGYLRIFTSSGLQCNIICLPGQAVNIVGNIKQNGTKTDVVSITYDTGLSQSLSMLIVDLNNGETIYDGILSLTPFCYPNPSTLKWVYINETGKQIFTIDSENIVRVLTKNKQFYRTENNNNSNNKVWMPILDIYSYIANSRDKNANPMDTLEINASLGLSRNSAAVGGIGGLGGIGVNGEEKNNPEKVDCIPLFIDFSESEKTLQLTCVMMPIYANNNKIENGLDYSIDKLKTANSSTLSVHVPLLLHENTSLNGQNFVSAEESIIKNDIFYNVGINNMSGNGIKHYNHNKEEIKNYVKLFQKACEMNQIVLAYDIATVYLKHSIKGSSSCLKIAMHLKMSNLADRINKYLKKQQQQQLQQSSNGQMPHSHKNNNHQPRQNQRHPRHQTQQRQRFQRQQQTGTSSLAQLGNSSINRSNRNNNNNNSSSHNNNNNSNNNVGMRQFDSRRNTNNIGKGNSIVGKKRTMKIAGLDNDDNDVSITSVGSSTIENKSGMSNVSNRIGSHNMNQNKNNNNNNNKGTNRLGPPPASRRRIVNPFSKAK